MIKNRADLSMALLLPAENASAWTGPTGTNTWLLRGRVPTLIDAGVGHPRHVAAIESALEGQPLAAILITHDHVDHSSGAAALKARWPSARVRLHGGADGMNTGERIAAGDAELEVLHTPGHSPDHCCLWREDTRELFCGDLVRSGGTVVIPAGRGGDLARYLESLRLIRNVAPVRLLPGHGPIIENPDDVIAEYLRHRAERDEQILAAIARGYRTPQEIVRHIYVDLPAAFEEAAAETVLAHLIKLRHEGRVAQTRPNGELRTSEFRLRR